MRAGCWPARAQAAGGAAQAGPVVEEPGDRRVALVFVRLWRHGEPGVVGDQSEHAVNVARLDGGGEAAGEPLTGNEPIRVGRTAVPFRPPVVSQLAAAADGHRRRRGD
jgi:hypothetical protein